jgi:hypothetical protein
MHFHQKIEARIARKIHKMKINLPDNSNKDDGVLKMISDAAKGLYYISETDAEIMPFLGSGATAVTREEILAQTGRSSDEHFEEVTPDAFFAELTRVQDWFGDPQKERAARFSALVDMLKLELTDLHVYRIGTIRIDIYVVGLTSEGRLAGVRTQSVET